MVEQDINYKLIKKIEMDPLLYNFKSPECSNKIVIENLWNEIEKITNIKEL